jgi:hypothetical protein
MWTFFVLCGITETGKLFKIKTRLRPEFTEGLWRGKEGGFG